MDKQGAYGLVECAQHALSASVLCRCVGAGHAKGGAAAVEEGARSSVVELTAIISLQGEDLKVEMCVREVVESLDGC
jgi:hypothetical protein